MAPRKKNKAAQYAFIGLIVSLVACVATGFVGLIKGMESLGIAALPLESQPDLLNQLLIVGVALIVLGIAAYGIMAPDSIRRFISGRQARYGSNALILTLAMLGILFVANMLAYQNPKKWDLTEDQSNTLANETLQALATLPDDVLAVAFYSNNMPTDSADELLTDFKINSNGKFDYRFVNPDTDPVQAREAGITGDGKILLLMGDRKEIAAYASETELTRALIRLINPEPRKVYFLSGHGEEDIASTMTVAKSTLESKNYVVNTLNLLAENKIPEDALSIIIAGPKKPLSSSEVTALKKYVDAGGSLVILQDPYLFTEFGDANDPLANYLVNAWGVTMDDNVIFDLSSQQPLQAISASATSAHPITQNLSANYVVIMPQARSLGVSGQIENVTQTPLIMTSPNSWGETNLEAGGEQVQYDEGVDLLGPLNMAIAAENTKTKGRVVVMGNSIFATDQWFDAYGNGNIFINSVDWAAEQENLINITPREQLTRTFNLPSSTQLIIILLGAIFIVPGLIVVMGISAWISRRRRG